MMENIIKIADMGDFDSFDEVGQRMFIKTCTELCLIDYGNVLKEVFSDVEF